MSCHGAKTEPRKKIKVNSETNVVGSRFATCKRQNMNRYEGAKHLLLSSGSHENFDKTVLISTHLFDCVMRWLYISSLLIGLNNNK